jgi:hypothetical protein
MNSFLSIFLLLSAPTLLVSFVLHSKQVKTRPHLSTAFLSKESEDADPPTKQFPTLVVSEMPAPLPDKLKNHYYFLRHGQSTLEFKANKLQFGFLVYQIKHTHF